MFTFQPSNKLPATKPSLNSQLPTNYRSFRFEGFSFRYLVFSPAISIFQATITLLKMTTPLIWEKKIQWQKK